MRETDRPHRALEELAKLWTERAYEARSLGRSPRYEGYALAMMEAAEELRAAFAPEQRGVAYQQKMEEAKRWKSEQHGDAPQEGELQPPLPDPATFGACYDCGRCYGDEYGFPDLVLPNDVWAKISPRGDEGGLLCPSCICRRAHALGMSGVPAMWASGPLTSRPYTPAAPTPDREALRDLIAALPLREPDWLTEYEWRKLVLIEAATICGRDGSNPEQDAAERALDDWVLDALPRGREQEREREIAELVLLYDDALREGSDADMVYQHLAKLAHETLTALPGGREREHPIGTCFAERGDMGEEWTYCPFCGGRVAWSSNSSEKRTTREREPDPLLEEAARYVEAMTRYQPDAHTRRLGREMAQCIRVMPAIEPRCDCGRPLAGRCEGCTIEDYQAAHRTGASADTGMLCRICRRPGGEDTICRECHDKYANAASADTGERA
jgi:hypothetical protein